MSPLYYPDIAEIERLCTMYRSGAYSLRVHRASNKDAFTERIRAEARAFKERMGLDYPLIHFEARSVH